MHELAVPLLLTCARIERHQRVPVQIIPNAIRAVEIRGRRTQRRVDNSAFHIDGEETPDIGSRSILPTTGRPSLRSSFSWPRHGVKSPQQLSCFFIPATDVAVGACSRRALSIATPRNDYVVEDGWWRLERIPSVFQIAEYTLLQIQPAFITKSWCRLASSHVQAQQE